MGFSWSLVLARNCNEEKACFASSLRRTGSESTTHLIHDHGPPLVFLAGEQGHGGAYVFVDTFRAVCDNLAFSQKMVSEKSDILAPLGLALHKTEEHLGREEALGTELDGPEPCSRVTSTRFWVMRQGLTALLCRGRCGGRALECVLALCTFVGSHVSRNVVHISHLSPLHSIHYLENGPT